MCPTLIVLMLYLCSEKRNEAKWAKGKKNDPAKLTATTSKRIAAFAADRSGLSDAVTTLNDQPKKALTGGGRGGDVQVSSPFTPQLVR